MRMILVWARQFATRLTRHCAGAFQVGFQCLLAFDYLDLGSAFCNSAPNNLKIRIYSYPGLFGFKQFFLRYDELLAAFNSEFKVGHRDGPRALKARIAELANGGLPLIGELA